MKLDEVSRYVEEIAVEGAGLKEVNGRYIRRFNTGFSPYPLFSRLGKWQWQGKEEEFKIYRNGPAWIIFVDGIEDFYINHNSFSFGLISI